MIEVFNIKVESNVFLDKVQLPALGIHHITIYHTHWKYLTSIFLYNNTLTVAMQVQSSTFISLKSCSNWNLQGNTCYYSLLQVRQKPPVPDFCTHGLLHCSSLASRNWYLAHALTLQVGSNIISFAFAAGKLVCESSQVLPVCVIYGCVIYGYVMNTQCWELNLVQELITINLGIEHSSCKVSIILVKWWVSPLIICEPFMCLFVCLFFT